jgi:rod shape-determining protein MreC
MRHGRAQSRSSGFFAGAAIVLGALVLVSQLPFLAGARGQLRGTLAPFEAGATAVESTAGEALSVFGDIAGLRSENRRLSTENAQLRAQQAGLQAAGAENAQLRRDLQFERTFGHHLVAAQVIGRGPDAFTRMVTIDRGTADGVQPGMSVVTGAGLVGRVREVSAHAAAVQTVADPLVRVNAYLVKSGLEGTVSGGQGPLRMDVQPRADVVGTRGEWALTSGIGGGYPRGIPVGQVTRFDRREASTVQYAELAWANDLAQLAAVLVVTDFLPS